MAHRRNSAIVVTTLFDDNGNAVEITDFAPRFKQFGRVFRPTMLVRHIRPLMVPQGLHSSAASIRSRGTAPERTRFNHIRY